MTDADKIAKLRDALSTMMDWASELGDEFLDGDDETRPRYRQDFADARAILKETAVLP